MALAPGARLGVYAVTAQIGEGGMGQVFRARDTTLDRDVAIKILPDAVAHDTDRLARFQREAKTLASLNHPNIAAIYGLEESGEVREIPGSAAATLRVVSLFWAPDGRQLVYSTATTTVMADVTTGAIRPLCECRFLGGSWGRDGTILLGSLQGAPGGIRRVTANDPTPVVVTNADPAKREEDQWPVFLPDGRRFLFTRMVAGAAPATYVGTIDGGTPTRVTDGSRRLFVPATEARSAYLLAMDSAGLVAQPFDENTASVTGAPVTLVAGAVAAASVSDNGVLATSRPGSGPRTVPTWFDRQGRALGTVGEAGLIQSLALTPDGRKLALDEFGSSPIGQASDVWLRDQQSGANTRMTFSPDNDSTPVWSPDGTRIAFSSFRDGMQRLHQRMANGTGDETPLVEFDRNAWINDWSSDGRWVIYSAVRPEGAENDLWAVPIEGGVARAPVPYIGGPARQQQAQFSPDGRFVAYGSDQSGTFEIYVQPFPNASGGKWMISNGGGTEPRWSRDGKELFYFSGQTLMAVPIRLQPTFSSGAATALFDAPVLANYTNDGHRWQVAPDAR